MKNDKTIKLINNKLKEDEVILDVFNIYDLTRQTKKYSYQLVICTQTIFLIYQNHIKKHIAINQIKFITLSCYSNQIIIHTNEQDLFMESYQNVKIINNILTIKRKVFQDLSLFTVYIQKDQSLRSYASVQSSFAKIFTGLFHKKQNSEQRLSNRPKNGWCLQVNDKNFINIISKDVYKNLYLNVQLLYNGGMHSFIFNEFDYKRQEIDDQQYLFYHKISNECLKMYKISKQSEQIDKKLRRYIENYRYEDYKQQVYFGIQTQKCFEIITPYYSNQQSLQHLILTQRNISEMDLLSIFYKLMMLIDGSFYVLHSLSPQHIFIKDQIIISSIRCINSNKINTNYIAPEELDNTLSLSNDPELINLWKIGVLLFEIAYSCIPFPAQYLAFITKSKTKLQLNFPHPYRTVQFKDFLSQLIQINPKKRGGGPSWKIHIYDHKWIRNNKLS